ncbi:bifunctional metallophosphatase/5'-nucleotidase [Dokdonia sp. Hel_I_53]|uniref:bifunctional metallophosphatase/5'-nucleotidase n=1 Tax=Dokdonia sp. Hel_I_53 TaxID=1566287 RepID=UPI0011996EA5|nr:metallophosphatase [Dokdonia sp. Hel_I_53]TVZ53262.1 5'-nucleotidase [Dokdonia sp. Hel_I_53]
MIRRHFLKQTAAAGSFLSLGGLTSSAFSIGTKKHITILHTNDVHSHIEPFPSNDSKYANLGGVSRRSTIIENIRKQEPNVLLLDAGDMFQGTPYFNFYGGELEFKLMSMMGYDAATIGNHDFDNGIGGLAAQVPNAKFKLLSANYDFKNTIMDGLTNPYSIYIKDEVRIGVFGIGLQLDGLVNKKMYKETVYLDPVEITTDTVNTLRNEGHCDLVICLSHLGYSYKDETIISDMTLAKKTSGIDLIIGGHTHTFLEKPTVVKNKDGQSVLINQVGWGGINLGRIDFILDDAKNVTNSSLILDV